ncbi:helix-turn-helix domain-containing protein [Bacillus weihaiensis]|uniref:helix-turn-helix domain-containing protein n=1 Tax=Bacillus weihaiensis TaxID=1547283 RepID=UPI002353827B|nr:helix-turn-helix domain-containing protein [Bacillus weihaiensis]
MNTEKKLMGLINSVRVLTSTLDLDEVLNHLIEEVLNVIEGANASVLFLYDKKIDRLYAKTAAGFDMEHLKKISLKPGEGMSGKTFLSRKGRIFLSETDTVEGMENISDHTMKYYGDALGQLRYPASALCVPLISKEDCIGVLTVDIYEKNVQFDESDLQLLETFAVQATIAIENAILFSRNERTKKMHEELSKVSLSQGGLEEITKTLAGLIDSKVAVIDEFLDVIVSSTVQAEKTAKKLAITYERLFEQAMKDEGVIYETIELEQNQQTRVYLFPIKTYKYTIGYLTIFLEGEAILDTIDRFAVEQASVIFALEMNRRETSTINDLKYSGYILDQILQNGYSALSHNQLSKINFFDNQNDRYVTVQAYIKDPLLSIKEFSDKKNQLIRYIYREITGLQFKTLVLDKNMEVVFLLMVPSRVEEAELQRQLTKVFNQLQKRAKEMLDISLLVGIGRMVPHLKEVQSSYRDTQKCIDFLQSTNHLNMILSYQELGTQRLFLKTERNELKDFVNDMLGPIITYDQENSTELLATLKVYLESNQNMALAAKRLYVHTNTIKYRLNTIKEIVSIDHLDGKKAFDLQLGLYVQEFLQL